MTDADSPGRALLSASFSFARPTLLCARAQLYEDHLELTGWRLWGRYRRRIPLGRVLQVDATSPNRLVLWMADGQTLRLHLECAQRWQQAITRRLDDA